MRSFSFLLFFILIVSGPNQAHPLDEGVLEVRLEGSTVKGSLRLPGDGFRFADESGDGLLSAAEIENHRTALETAFATYFELLGDGTPPQLRLRPTRGAPSLSHVEVGFVMDWPEQPEAFTAHFKRYDWDYKDPPSCLASFLGGEAAQTHIFRQEESVFDFRTDQVHNSVMSFFRLGLEHILEGYDHLLFLLALMFAGGGFWVLFKMVTAFTVTHSITLGMAVLGLGSLPGWIVEPIIVGSIILAAVENWRRPEPEGRWKLAAGFGLIHGMGFAGVLADMSLSGPSALKPLLGFNLGVEAGQLLVVVLVYSFLFGFERSENWRRVQLAGSAVCALFGCYWLFQMLSGAA